ncbi:ABC transporter ATP-binding protein [Halogeometricum borinquense]|uniref:ABC transporter ATP-binding protein n=1 Tax=Halogeometricum borinquense TaxID=60847 RepID=A0A6C0UGT9_9EURY|nr:ABC transporter ATP-binding protein [Halogeometricum borinquense]QIB74692.1 ABC transporter ATP-binding protein [Halogeometricum borinquense]QIQ76353.1 ABC transporter ATP-binding protein [Halogeometricum borinquense]
MLRTTGLTKTFGGLTAVDGVDFELGGDELCSLIGPNGAGKTTFFNLLTGALTATAGTIEFRRGSESSREDGGSNTDGAWQDITTAASHEAAAMGIHRSYQITNVFPTSTVFENVRIAAQANGDDATTFWRNANHYDEYETEARAILERVGLTEHANVPASSLSHGEKRQLEVGIALAGDPDVLLLDEPNAGVSSESVGDIIDLIEDVATDHAVLLVEHNMDIVMNVSDRVVVLNQGKLIADGSPADVRDNEAVQRAYLGGYESGTRRGSESDGADAPDEESASAEGSV